MVNYNSGGKETIIMPVDCMKKVLSIILMLSILISQHSYAAMAQETQADDNVPVLDNKGYYSFIPKNQGIYEASLYCEGIDYPICTSTWDINDEEMAAEYGNNIIGDVTESGLYYVRVTLKNKASGSPLTYESNRIEYIIPEEQARIPELIHSSASENKASWTYVEEADFYEIQVADAYDDAYIIEKCADESGVIAVDWSKEYFFNEMLTSNHRFRIRSMVYLNNESYRSSDWSDWYYDYWYPEEEIQDLSKYFNVDAFTFNEDGCGDLTYEWKDIAWAKKNTNGIWKIFRDGIHIQSYPIWGSDDRDGKVPFSYAVTESGRYTVGIFLTENGKDKILVDTNDICSVDYTKPGIKMESPADLWWNGSIATFKGVDNNGGYCIEFYRDGELMLWKPILKSTESIVTMDMGNLLKKYPKSNWVFRVVTLPFDNTLVSASDYIGSTNLGPEDIGIAKVATKSITFSKSSITVPQSEYIYLSSNRTIDGLNDDKMIEESPGNTPILSLNVVPINSNDIRKLYYTSDNMDILEIRHNNEDYYAYPMEVGHTNINAIAELKDGSVRQASIPVNILERPEKILIENEEFDAQGNTKVFKGYQGKLSYNILPDNAANLDGVWCFNEESSTGKAAVNTVTGTRYAVYRAIEPGMTLVQLHVDDISASYAINVVDTITVHYEDDKTEDTTIPALYNEPIGSIKRIVKPVCEGKVFAGWFTEPNGKGQRVTSDTTATDQFDIYAYWENDNHSMRVRPIVNGVYNGSAVKPLIEIYDGQTGKLLVERTDYTVTYKNNINSWIKGDDRFNQGKDKNGYYIKAPTITITGRGNYSGKQVITFNIYPANINTSSFIIEDIILAYNSKKVQKAKPIVKRGTKELASKDIVVRYIDDLEEYAYKEPGDYRIEITGTGNYTGTKIIKLTITKDNMINKASVMLTKGQKVMYTGKEVKPSLEVKIGKTKLTENKDYCVAYENNIEAGIATAVITGKNDYIGTKKVTFRIAGENIAKASVGHIEDQTYVGEELEPEVILSLNGKAIPSSDYSKQYLNNTEPGIATIIITGKNQYKGTAKKITFRIMPCPISKATVTINETTIPYIKGGTRPSKEDITVSYAGRQLIEDTDYIVVCKDNNRITDEASLVVKGKGRFTGNSMDYIFRIVRRDMLEKGYGEIKVVVADKLAKANKAGVYKSTATVMQNGKKLSNRDYDTQNVEYTYVKDNNPVRADDIIAPGTEIKVTVKARDDSNYSGEAYGYYRVVAKDVARSTVDKLSKIYTGSEIRFTGKEDLGISIKEPTGLAYLENDVDYEIVENSYTNNIKKGKAKVTIRGIGEYGGTKIISFAIVAKPVSDSEIVK